MTHPSAAPPSPVRSIRARLTHSLLAGGFALVVAAGLGVYLAMAALLEDQFDDTLIAKSEALVTASEIDEDGFEIDLVIQDFADFGVLGADHFEMRHPDGRVFARSPSADGLALPRPAHRPEGVVIDDATLADGRRVRVLHRLFTPKDDHARAFTDRTLTVTSPRAAIDRALALLAAVLAAVGALALVALAPLVRRGLAHGLAPLTALNDRLRDWRGEAGFAPDPDRLPQELRPLAEALTESLGRVARSLDRERRFSAHAAHELRTPLAEIRALAETITRWPDDAPADAAEIVEVADRMTRLLGQLAILARAEAGPIDGDAAPLDPAAARAAIDDALAARADDIAARGLQIEDAITALPPITHDALWRSVVDNLIGNAVAHAPDGARVRVHAAPDTFAVANPAPQLTRDDLPLLFERFWRPPGARADAHLGLGLSITRACAARLGATVDATLADGTLEIRVRWP